MSTYRIVLHLTLQLMARFTEGATCLPLVCLLVSLLYPLHATGVTLQASHPEEVRPASTVREVQSKGISEAELTERGVTAFQEGSYQDAVRYFSAARKVDPSNSILAAALGQAFLSAGNPAAAIGPLRDALSARPNDKTIVLALAQSYQRLNRDADVLGLLKPEQRDDSLHPVLLFVLSFSQFRMNQFEQAESGFHKLLKVPEMRAPASFFIANCHFGQGDLEVALPWYEKAIRLAQTSKVVGLNAYYYDYGLALFRLNRYTDAESAFKSSIAQYPKDPLPHFFLGRSAAKNGQIEDAISVFTQLTHDHPDFDLAYYQLALLYRQKGETSRSQAMFAKFGRLKNAELESQRLLMKLKVGDGTNQRLLSDR